MKNQLQLNLRNAAKNMFTFLAVAALVIAGTTSAQASDTPKNTPVEIKYLGSFNSKPVFEIAFDNADSEEIYLTLKDNDGNILYSEVVKDKKFSRKIQLDNEELYGSKVTLTLRSRKGTQHQVFQINKNVRVVEDVQIARVQ
jgi:hypothetical protein